MKFLSTDLTSKKSDTDVRPHREHPKRTNPVAPLINSFPVHCSNFLSSINGWTDDVLFNIAVGLLERKCRRVKNGPRKPWNATEPVELVSLCLLPPVSN